MYNGMSLVVPKSIPENRLASFRGISDSRGNSFKGLSRVNSFKGPEALFETVDQGRSDDLFAESVESVTDSVAARIENVVLQTEQLVKARSHTYLLLCILAFIGVAAQVWEVEILSANDNAPTASTDNLKWVVTTTTILSLWLMYVYYKDSLTLGQSKKVYSEQETILSTRLAYPMLLEMLILAIHPLPCVYDTMTWESAHNGLDYTYSADALLSLFVVARTYLLYRGVHYWLGFETSTDARMLATLNHVDMGPEYTFRHIMAIYPFMTISTLLVLLLTISAYALRIAERPNGDANEGVRFRINGSHTTIICCCSP
jgi:hypothetical protein